MDKDKPDVVVPDRDTGKTTGGGGGSSPVYAPIFSMVQVIVEPAESRDFVQTDTEIQAINIIRSRDDLKDNHINIVKQTAVFDDFRFYQPNENNRLQTGNAVISDGHKSGQITQNWTSKSLSMIQENDAGSIQAVNYIGKDPK